MHAPFVLVEFDAGLLELEPAEVEDSPHAAFEVLDDVLVLDAQDPTRQHCIPVIHQPYIHCVIAPDVFEAVRELLAGRVTAA